MIKQSSRVLALLALCVVTISCGVPATGNSNRNDLKEDDNVAPVEPGKPDKDAPKEFTTTKSGLKYRILRKASGEKPKATDTVKVHYKGWLLKGGKEFDSSYKRGEPATFPLNRVIKGWTEGLQLVNEGGMIELEIPPELGYGDNGAGDAIPPKATLRFLVELLEIK